MKSKNTAILAFVSAFFLTVAIVFGQNYGNTRPLYRLRSDSDQNHFYTSREADKNTYVNKGYKFESVIGRVITSQRPGTVPLHRLYNPSEKNHFYTTQDNYQEFVDRKYSSYEYEGVVGYVYKEERPNTIPLFRLRSDSQRNHFYTTNPGERDNATNKGYKYERIECYILPPEKQNQKTKQNVSKAKVSGRVLFSDDFSRPSSLNASYRVIDCKNPKSKPSEWFIEGGRLYQSSNIYRGGSDEYKYFEGTHLITKSGQNWSDYEVTVDFKILGDNDGVGVLFRYIDENHFYRFITVMDKGNKGPFRRLQAKVGSEYVTLAESTARFDTKKEHTIRIHAVGNTLSVYFDDDPPLQARDSRYHSGRVGLLCYAEQPVFDNLVVRESK